MTTNKRNIFCRLEWNILHKTRVSLPDACKKIKNSTCLKGKKFKNFHKKAYGNCREKLIQSTNKIADLKNDHTRLVNWAFKCRFVKKKLPEIWLWPRVGKFIVKFHRIDVLDAMARSSLVLDTPNICGFSRFGLRC